MKKKTLQFLMSDPCNDLPLFLSFVGLHLCFTQQKFPPNYLAEFLWRHVADVKTS